MILQELRDCNPPSELQKVDSSEFDIIWILDYYDGPISGMLQLENELFWFEMTQENENWEKDGWYRRYGVIRLTNELLTKELEVHRDFQKYVRTHWDKILLKTPPKLIKNQQNEFYDKHSEYVRSSPFEQNILLGWMEN